MKDGRTDGTPMGPGVVCSGRDPWRDQSTKISMDNLQFEGRVERTRKIDLWDHIISRCPGGR